MSRLEEWMEERKEQMAERREWAKEARQEKKEARQRNYEMQKHWWQRIFVNLKYTLFGISDEDEFVITEDMVRIWITQGVSVLVAFMTGMFSYWLCGKRVFLFHNDLVSYKIGALTEPPEPLWFFMNLLWLILGAVALSLVLMGIQHVICWLFVIRNVDDAEDVRMTAIAVSCLVYVITIVVMALVKFPIPGIQWM